MIFMLLASNAMAYTFETAAFDLDSAAPINSHVIMLNGYTDEVMEADAATTASFEVGNNQLYFVTYSASGYGSDTDAMYFDAGISTCDKTSSPCVLNSNDYKTTCEYDADVNAWYCETEDKADGKSYFVYDEGDGKILKKANRIQKGGESTELFFMTFAVDALTGQSLNGVDIKIMDVVKTANPDANFILATNTKYSIEYSKTGYETEGIDVYLDSRLSQCDESATTCILPENDDELATSCVLDDDTGLFECSVLEDGQQEAFFLYDFDLDAVVAFAEMEQAEEDAFEFVTSAFDDDTLTQIESITVTVLGQSKTAKSPEFVVPHDQVFSIAYSAPGYLSDTDELYVDSGILGCDTNVGTCLINNNGFITTGNYDAAEEVWYFEAKDSNDNTAYFVYDADSEEVKKANRLQKDPNAPVSPNADAGLDQNVGVNTNVNFDGSGSNDPDGSIVSYSWNFGDGATASGVSQSHSFASAGVKTVTLTVTDNDGLVDSDTVQITVAADATNVGPTANAGNDQTVNVGEEVSFDGSLSTDSDGTIVNYHWDFGDGAAIDATTPTHIFTSFGNYTVTLTVTDNDGAAATDSVFIIANGVPTAITGGPYSGFVNTSVRFDASQSSDNGNIVEYYWDFGDGNTVIGMNPAHQFAFANTYIVTLRVTDNDGLVDTETTTAVITKGTTTQVQEPKHEKTEVTIERIGSVSGDFASPGDVVQFKFRAENSGDKDLSAVRYTAFMPELGVWTRVGPFDLDSGDEETKTLMLEIPEFAEEGEYVVRFKISQGGETLRTKHRFIRII